LNKLPSREDLIWCCKDIHQIDDELIGRFSNHILKRMYFDNLFFEDYFCPIRLKRSIFDLEGLNKSSDGKILPSRTKEPKPLKNPMFSGLMHKHVEMSGIKSHIKNSFPNNEITLENLQKQNYRYRISNSKVTGEWLMYKKYLEKNYYLLSCSHTDNEIYYQNERESLKEEFPFLDLI